MGLFQASLRPVSTFLRSSFRTIGSHLGTLPMPVTYFPQQRSLYKYEMLLRPTKTFNTEPHVSVIADALKLGAGAHVCTTDDHNSERYGDEEDEDEQRLVRIEVNDDKLWVHWIVEALVD